MTLLLLLAFVILYLELAFYLLLSLFLTPSSTFFVTLLVTFLRSA